MNIANDAKYVLAKTFTELAIQNGLITCYENATDTANEVATFFNTIIDTIGSIPKSD